MRYKFGAPKKPKEQNLDQERRQAHALLDMDASLSHSLALAPVEDEEITAETAASLDRARASLARGEGSPYEEILREFGRRK